LDLQLQRWTHTSIPFI